MVPPKRRAGGRTYDRWSDKNLEDLEEYYWAEIAPVARRDGLDPSDEPPTHEWVLEHGFGSFVYALRKYHDTTFLEFAEDEVGLDAGPRSAGEDDYRWTIEDDGTIDALERWLDSLSMETRRNLSETTVATIRSRLQKFVSIYADLNGAAALVDRAADASLETDEIRRAESVFDVLRAEASSDRSVIRYHEAVHQWYEWLVNRARAEFNPVATLPQTFGWERENPDTRALTTEQVRSIHETARIRGSEEELLVLGTCAWGLRANEVATLHSDQLVVDDDDPRIVFDERKNGPGSVTIIYGVKPVGNRLVELESRENDWTGYLFPSPEDPSNPISTRTVQRRFKSLAEAAGVSISRSDGEEIHPTPHMGRRFWYQNYLDAAAELAEYVTTVAEEQGSSDPGVVQRHYDDDDRKRQRLRGFMERRLQRAFEPGVDTS